MSRTEDNIALEKRGKEMPYLVSRVLDRDTRKLKKGPTSRLLATNREEAILRVLATEGHKGHLIDFCEVSLTSKWRPFTTHKGEWIYRIKYSESPLKCIFYHIEKTKDYTSYS